MPPLLGLVGGPDGTGHEPGTDFRFIEESQGGTLPKFIDLGATFGRTGNSLNRSKGVLNDYAETRSLSRGF